MVQIAVYQTNFTLALLGLNCFYPHRFNMHQYNIDAGSKQRNASHFLMKKFTRELPRTPVNSKKAELEQSIDVQKVRDARQRLSKTFDPEMLGIKNTAERPVKRSVPLDLPKVDIMARISVVGSALFSNYVHQERPKYVFCLKMSFFWMLVRIYNLKHIFISFLLHFLLK